MRKYLPVFAIWILFLSFLSVLVLSGCGSNNYQVKPTPTVEEIKKNPQQAAFDNITNFNAVVAASAISLKANKLSFTPEQYKQYRDSLRDAARYADEAEVYAEEFDLTSSADKLKLADIALSIVQAELIKLKNKEKK
jgi:hypothetical protein